MPDDRSVSDPDETRPSDEFRVLPPAPAGAAPAPAAGPFPPPGRRAADQTVILPLTDRDPATLQPAPLPPPAPPAAPPPLVPATAVAASRSQGEGDDDFRVLAVDAFKPQQIVLGPNFRHLRGFVVFISRAAVTNILRHGAKGLQTEFEVAGGLVGRPGYDPESGLIFTHITAALAVHGKADRYEVEIPPEEWFRLSNLVHDEEPYRGESILVGWYHSHPTFEAYLSELDQQTQRQFFGEIWNVAIVIGPLLRQIKAFHGAHSQPCPLYLDPEETGDTLVEVSYEVSAGAVSTTAGIEWLDPPAGSPPDLATTTGDFVVTPPTPEAEEGPPDPAYSATGTPAADYAPAAAPLAYLPPAMGPAGRPPAAGPPATMAGQSPASVPPLLIGLILVGIILLAIVAILLVLNLTRP